jgi:thiamine-phosphate pyrophosphorylase
MTELYLITPPYFELESFKPKLREALEGGQVKVLQLRMKSQAADGTYTAEPDWNDVKKAAKELLPIAQEFGVAFILNDNPALAKEIGADGVHVGDEDLSVAEVRKIVGENFFIGASCYASKDRAFEAAEQGADYVAFGAFYETQTKKPKGRPDVELLRFWQDFTTIPCVAIGGIKPDNAAPLVQNGADFIAVVTGVWDHPKGIKSAIDEYSKVIAENRVLEASAE